MLRKKRKWKWPTKRQLRAQIESLEMAYALQAQQLDEAQTKIERLRGYLRRVPAAVSEAMSRIRADAAKDDL
jgi:hypothetical protein